MSYPGFESYDILRLSVDGGKTFQDYCTIRDEGDARLAKRLVDGERFGGHQGGTYRIYGHKPGEGTVIKYAGVCEQCGRSVGLDGKAYCEQCAEDS